MAGVLQLPPPLVFAIATALHPPDLVAFGLTCRASAFFVFAEDHVEFREDAARAGDDAGTKPVITSAEGIPEHVLESWKVWRALAEAAGFDSEPRRSPLMVMRHRSATERNWRRGAYIRHDLCWTATEEHPVGPGLPLRDAGDAVSSPSAACDEAEAAAAPPPAFCATLGPGKQKKDRSNLTRVFSMQLFFSAEGLPRALTVHEQDSWRAAVKFVGDSLLWDVHTQRIIDLCKFPHPEKFLPEFMQKGADGPCGNYDCTESHFVTVVGDSRSALAVYGTPKGEAADGPPRRLHLLEGHRRPITWLVVHDTLAFTSSYDFTVRVWDIVAGGPAVHTYTFPGAALRLLALRRRVGAGILVVSTCTEGSLRAFSGDGSAVVGVREAAHAAAILCVEACPCSAKIVTGCRDGCVGVWLVEQREAPVPGGVCVEFVPLATLRGHTRWITSVAIDHYRVLSASMEGLRLWSFADEDAPGTGGVYEMLPMWVLPPPGTVVFHGRRRLTDAAPLTTQAVVVTEGRPRGEAARSMDDIIAAGKARFWKAKCDGK